MRSEKAYLVQELTERIKEYNGLFVTSYLGLSSENLSSLRRECHKADSRFMVVKNRILKIALENAGFEVSEDVQKVLKESTAVAFTKEDAVQVAKLLIKFGDDKGLPKVKGGYVEGNWFNEDRVVQFSKLPSREVLLGKLVGALQGPLYSLVSVLSAPQRNLVYCLKAIADKKQSEES